MRKIILLGAAPIDGTMRFPSEGAISVSNDVADDLIKVGLAQDDNLDQLKADEVRKAAADAGVPLGPKATRDEGIAAIRERRANA